MNLTQVRNKLKDKLGSGEIQHEARRDIDKKNKLATGEVTPEEVIKFLNRTLNHDFSTSKHHKHSEIDVYELKPLVHGTRWYIKAYFIDPDVWFISVHK